MHFVAIDAAGETDSTSSPQRKERMWGELNPY